MHELFDECRILYQVCGFLFDSSRNYRHNYNVIEGNFMKLNNGIECF